MNVYAPSSSWPATLLFCVERKPGRRRRGLKANWKTVLEGLEKVAEEHAGVNG